MSSVTYHPKLTGKVALITGGSSGIGLATAKRFAREGARVFITGRRPAELQAGVAQIGHGAVGIQGDVSNLADLDRLYAEIAKQADHLDVIFANAGGYEFAPFGQITEGHFDRTFAINVKGLLFTIQKALPFLRDGGSVILNASIVASKGLPSFSVYSATKAAVRSFARTWTVDLKQRRIRVNAISPGPIDTPGVDGLAATPDQRSHLKADMTATVPLGRMGDPDDIAKAASFLASDESSFISGIELFVDGGMAQI